MFTNIHPLLIDKDHNECQNASSFSVLFHVVFNLETSSLYSKSNLLLFLFLCNLKIKIGTTTYYL